jgi:hypothetical protein
MLRRSSTKYVASADLFLTSADFVTTADFVTPADFVTEFVVTPEGLCKTSCWAVVCDLWIVKCES